MTFGEGDPVVPSPWWVAGGLGVTTIVFAALRVYDYYKRKKAEWDAKQQSLDAARRKFETETRQDLTEEQKEARRDSETEAWRVVDRLTIEVEGFTEKIRAVEDRERVCAEERAGERMILRILVVWARKQKNPPPIPDDVLDKLSEGSGMHLPLPQKEGTQ